MRIFKPLKVGRLMRVTNYFLIVLLKKHPETLQNLRAIVEAVDTGNLEGYQVESSGRIRQWVYIANAKQYFRIVFLADHRTVLNAFPDSRYRGVKS